MNSTSLKQQRFKYLKTFRKKQCLNEHRRGQNRFARYTVYGLH